MIFLMKVMSNHAFVKILAEPLKNQPLSIDKLHPPYPTDKPPYYASARRFERHEIVACRYCFWQISQAVATPACQSKSHAQKIGYYAKNHQADLKIRHPMLKLLKTICIITIFKINISILPIML